MRALRRRLGAPAEPPQLAARSLCPAGRDPRGQHPRSPGRRPPPPLCPGRAGLQCPAGRPADGSPRAALCSRRCARLEQGPLLLGPAWACAGHRVHPPPMCTGGLLPTPGLAPAGTLLRGGPDTPVAPPGCGGSEHVRASSESSHTSGRLLSVPGSRVGPPRPPGEGEPVAAVGAAPALAAAAAHSCLSAHVPFVHSSRCQRTVNDRTSLRLKNLNFKTN